MVSEGDSFIGHLTTVGRVTGRPHRVLLRLVYHAGRFYASRSDSSSDWCRNLIANPDVTVLVEGEELPASARLLRDEALARQGNRVLTKEHLEEVVLDPTCFKPFPLYTPFEGGFLLQHIEGNLA